MPSNETYISLTIAKRIRKYFFSAALILTAGVISAERFLGVGADYEGYIDIFVQKGFVREPVEPAYIFLRYVNDCLLSGQVGFIYLISALTALALKMHAFRNLSSHANLILCCYFLSFYLIHEYTQIRAAVAIGIFLCSIRDINNNKPFCYICKTLIATLFHYSAIIMIFCWTYVRFANTKKKCVFITISGFFVSIFLESTPVLTEYVYLIQEAVGLNKSGIESNFMSPWNTKYLMLLSLFIYLSAIIKKDDVKNFTLFKIYSFGLCCYYYLLPIQLPVISVRLAEFYTVVLIILLVNIAYDNNYCTKKKRFMLLSTALLVSVLYGYAAMKTITII